MPVSALVNLPVTLCLRCINRRSTRTSPASRTQSSRYCTSTHLMDVPLCLLSICKPYRDAIVLFTGAPLLWEICINCC
jgi:hypothetical protein